MYYDHIINITKDYLGPASKRFVDRQISNHLRKKPETLDKSDINTLAIRIRSGLVVLSADPKTVNEAFNRIMSIADLDNMSKKTNSENSEGAPPVQTVSV